MGGYVKFGSDDTLNCINFKLSDRQIVSGNGLCFFQNNKLVTLVNEALSYSVIGAIDFYLGLTNTIKSLKSNSMILVDEYGDERYFSKTTGIPNENNGSQGGEAPYVIDFTYTATQNTITVKFLCTERPTSASVMYGETALATNTTSSPEINGKQVSTTVKGLKSGTKYFFKCIVRNEHGSSTSDAFPTMTNN